jgi:transposase
MFDIRPSALCYWYRNYLSDYKSDISSGEWPAEILYDVDEQTGEIFEQKPLAVFKPENIGEQMSIDDKGLCHDGYTIMSNTQTGKMAMMLESTTCKDVTAALKLFGEQELDKIKSISCDMSPTYLKACKDVLPQAERVIDKFHVMQYVYDAVEAVRLRIKRDLMKKLSKGKKKTDEDKEILSQIEQLRRCRHRLSQSQKKWSENGKILIYQLFETYPDLKTAYELSQELKRWYNLENAQKQHRIYIERDLQGWYYKVEDSNIKELQGLVKMIDKHETEIVNFFTNGHTNAKAERLNGKIQRFVTNNYGMKDKDFALYRIAGYFS